MEKTIEDLQAWMLAQYIQNGKDQRRPYRDDYEQGLDAGKGTMLEDVARFLGFDLGNLVDLQAEGG